MGTPALLSAASCCDGGGRCSATASPDLRGMGMLRARVMWDSCWGGGGLPLRLGRAGLWGRRSGGSEGLSLCPSAHHSAAQSRGCTWVGRSQSSGFPAFGAPGAQCYEVGCPHPRRDVPSAAHSQGLHYPPKAEGSAEGTPDFMPPTVWQWGGVTPSLGSAGAAIHPHQNCHLYGRKAKGRASTEQLQEEILYHLQLDASLWGGGDSSQTISAERNRERDGAA